MVRRWQLSEAVLNSRWQFECELLMSARLFRCHANQLFKKRLSKIHYVNYFRQMHFLTHYAIEDGRQRFLCGVHGVHWLEFKLDDRNRHRSVMWAHLMALIAQVTRFFKVLFWWPFLMSSVHAVLPCKSLKSIFWYQLFLLLPPFWYNCVFFSFSLRRDVRTH